VSYLLIFLGIILLYTGGELLVRNASHLARTFGLSSLVIGLTVVAFGTSSPELATTLLSTLEGSPEVAVGNVIGSNIANIGFILGLTALIYPLQSARAFIRRELPFMIAVGALLIPVFWDGVAARYEGAALLALLVGYLVYQFWQSGRAKRRAGHGKGADEAPATFQALDVSSSPDTKTDTEPADAELPATVPLWRAVLGVALGIGVLVAGAQALVSGAVTVAQGFGVPERVIGLTLVALGTSLPELASSLVAAVRREADIILGNVVGSNVFNSLAILGVTALARPVRTDYADVQLDLWVMLALSIFLLPLMLGNYRLGRRGGAALLASYAAYMVFLFL